MAKYSRLAAALCDMDLKDYDFDSPYDQYPIDKALKEKYGIENIDILRILVKNLLSCIKITESEFEDKFYVEFIKNDKVLLSKLVKK